LSLDHFPIPNLFYTEESEFVSTFTHFDYINIR